ncbi:hypothetical protein PROFUN_12367 [Planoprotostelium fungivorum]|uniref:Uncharacterized protein n=1 Tax=Planoprotostelium fungivorum TaxID=1890364 RepID=A0A2P6N7F1_9EUKA|nr:hypothetical protein PROFUN_12367 [Planoprotostelium fungivorum]
MWQKIRENDENIRNEAVPTARLKNAYASMNQYLRQAALMWKTVRPNEEFSWKTLFNRSFIKIWIWFWDKRASMGETSFATPQNRVKGIAEVINRSMAYLPEDADQEYYSTQIVVSRDLLNGARSIARGTEAANRAANLHRGILEQNKQWFTQTHFCRMIHEALQIFRRVTYYQSHEGHLDLLAARRLQDALIILLSLSAGGQRPQFVHLLEYDTIDGNPKIGFFLRMPDEKISTITAINSSFLGYFVKHARPVLMSEDQQEAWYRSQDPHLSAEKRKVAIRQIDCHLFYDTKGKGAEPKSVDCCIKNFVSTYVPEAKYGTGMSIRRCFASYVFLGWQTETGERVEVGDYCKLINTSEKMFMDHYNREAGTEKLRETQDKLSKSLHPTSHNKSVSDILGFIRDIDNVIDQEDERKESDQEQEEETYDLCDLEEYPTQYEWIQANPSQNRSYNYKGLFEAPLQEERSQATSPSLASASILYPNIKCVLGGSAGIRLFGTLGDDFYKKLNSRSNLALILGVLKRYCSAEESDDPYNMHLWSQIDPIPNVAYKPCLLATTPGTTLLPITKVAEDWDAEQLRALQSAEQFIKDVDEHWKWYQTPTVSDNIVNFWEWSTHFPDQHEDVSYQVGRPPGELSSCPLWSVYTSEIEQNNRPMYIAYEDIDNQWTLGKIIKFCNCNGYKVQQMIFADPQWRLLNCYEIVFPQRVIHQDVKFKRNQTNKRAFKAHLRTKRLLCLCLKESLVVHWGLQYQYNLTPAQLGGQVNQRYGRLKQQHCTASGTTVWIAPHHHYNRRLTICINQCIIKKSVQCNLGLQFS